MMARPPWLRIGAHRLAGPAHLRADGTNHGFVGNEFTGVGRRLPQDRTRPRWPWRRPTPAEPACSSLTVPLVFASSIAISAPSRMRAALSASPPVSEKLRPICTVLSAAFAPPPRVEATAVPASRPTVERRVIIWGSLLRHEAGACAVCDSETPGGIALVGNSSSRVSTCAAWLRGSRSRAAGRLREPAVPIRTRGRRVPLACRPPCTKATG